MICPNCGSKMPDNIKYCTRCSATLPRKKGAGPNIDIKTIIIIVLAIVLFIGAIVFIKSKLTKSSSEEVTEEETEATEEETEEETEAATEEASETTEEENKTDWTADNSLTVKMTDKTDFTFKTMKVKSSEEEDSDEDEDENKDDSETENETEEEEFEVSSNLTISESSENMPDGYKLITATFVHDVSGSDGDSGVIADGAFDRYTGTYFGFEKGRPEQSDDEKADMDGFIRVTNGDDHYDIAIATKIETNGSSIVKTINVCCPSDYDGTVFYAGYDSQELDNEFKQLDLTERLYTFNELPFMNDEHDTYYFSYEKTDSEGRSSWESYEVEKVEETTTTDSKPGRPSK